ncbi:MAG: sortase [Chloroflexota bacterium]
MDSNITNRPNITWLPGLLTALTLAACGTSAPSPGPALPAPIVNVTHADTLPTPLQTPESLPAPVSLEIDDLASNLFGDRRLIERVRIPAIGVNSEVVPVGWQRQFGAPPESDALEWDSPGDYVGWVINSALPDQRGNTILYGHNNLFTAVFRDLWKLEPGDRLYLQTAEGKWEYLVDQIVIIPIEGAADEERAAYDAYFYPSVIPRLTLVSCWPPDNNTHRVIVTAYPLQLP